MTTQKLPTLGILMGEPAGVGPEIIAKLCAWDRIGKYCKFVLIGDSRVLKNAQRIAKVCFDFNIVEDIDKANLDTGITMLDLKNINPSDIKLGHINDECTMAAGEALIKAIELCGSRKIDGFTFAPFYNSDLKYGFNSFKDDIELIADKLQWTEPCGEIIVLDDFCASRVTGHIPLKDVIPSINISTIMRAVKLANDTLKLYGVSRPRIALAGINPHAGENGIYGNEEQELIIPAVKLILEEGINVIGPVPLETLFVNAFNGMYDAVVTMYHDQGLSAMKLKELHQGVTVFAGFPYGITKGMNGVELDIAGKGIAKTEGVERAIKVCAKICSNLKESML